jgi:hypothetical protein
MEYPVNYFSLWYFVYHKPKLIWFLVPKVASTSIRHNLTIRFRKSLQQSNERFSGRFGAQHSVQFLRKRLIVMEKLDQTLLNEIH